MASSEATSTVPASLLMEKHCGDPGIGRSTHLKRCSRLRFLILGGCFHQDEIWNNCAVFEFCTDWFDYKKYSSMHDIVAKALYPPQLHDVHPGMLFKQIPMYAKDCWSLPFTKKVTNFLSKLLNGSVCHGMVLSDY